MAKSPNLDLIRQINEMCGTEHEESSTLTPDQMREIAHHARQLSKSEGMDLAEAIGLQLENIPGLEGMDFEQLIHQILSYL